MDAELFGRKIGEARELADRLCPVRAVIATKDLAAHKEPLGEWGWEPVPGSDKAACQLDPALRDRLKELKVAYETEESGGGAGSEFAEQVEAIERWYLHDWTALDAKLRTSIVEGISVFLSLFDQPQVAGVFCPPPPPAEEEPPDEAAPDENDGTGHPVPGLRRRLPPLSELIEGGKVLALNMPAGANPALARAIGVLLKNAWMQALLRRPAVFICDEYQAFATVGQDDPSGDEKAFALTRQCRCVPIVATQSISSLRSVLPGGEAWRTLLQTLRTRIFLSLSDESSARIASEMCGSVMKTQPSYTFTETTGRPEFSLLSGRAGGGRGTIGASKSFRQAREPVFTPREFALLANYQAICLPYDDVKSLPCPARLPETPLPAEGDGLLAAPRGGTDMKRASGIGHLKPFLPGLETLLEDPEVSEIMINGPGNVWVERGGRLEPHEAPGLTAAWLHRAAIHIARPLGLDPAARPILDARLEDGSRVAICTPPASPEVAITIRRFGGRAFSADDLVRMGSLPETVLGGRPVGPLGPQEHPGLRRHGLGQDDALERADRVAARRRADRRDRGHARTQDRPRQLPPLRGRSCRHRDPRLDPRPGAARAAPPARPHRRRRGQGRRGRRSAPGAQHRPRRVADHHPREQRQLRALAPGELRHAGRRRASLGGHLPRRRGRDRTCAAHGPATGQAVRRGGARSARLRHGQGPLDRRTDLGRGRRSPTRTAPTRIRDAGEDPHGPEEEDR